jgi:hypothetical protein
MPKIGTPRRSDVCPRCRNRFKWSESKNGLCYWCEKGKADGVGAVALAGAPVKTKVKRRV